MIERCVSFFQTSFEPLPFSPILQTESVVELLIFACSGLDLDVGEKVDYWWIERGQLIQVVDFDQCSVGSMMVDAGG